MAPPYNNQRGGRRDDREIRTVQDPYLALGLSDEEKKTGRATPMLDQLVTALAKGAVDAKRQTDLGKWIEGEKFGKLPEDAKALALKLQERITAKAVSLAAAAKNPAPWKPVAQDDRAGDRRGGARPPTRDETNNASGANPSVLGEAFHNPYTFIPFPPSDWFQEARARHKPTPLSMDEVELDRFTGVIELELQTLAPLLSCLPDPTHVDEATKHKTYRALTSGDDVIVPATGVRGSLRSLMSVLAGGTLGYIDEGVWLTQGRDNALGPKGKSSPPDVPTQCFLAEVVSPGSETRPGKLRLGRTKLIPYTTLEEVASRRGITLQRPEMGREIAHLWVSESEDSISTKRDAVHCWKLKLSGRPINTKGKREGLFLDDGEMIDVPADLWAAYLGRHRHGAHRELSRGDLVWLEPENPGTIGITRHEDIASIQWARWGRRGEQLLETIRTNHPHMLPDAFNPDGLVDEVTDLFGQVPVKEGAAGPFAARVRPENLVFANAARDGLVAGVALAPLQPPHPGCAAFYRGNSDPDTAANRGALRGFKVYRTTEERGDKAPWSFSSQGVYKADGKLDTARQKVNRTCDLLAEGRTGTLRIACRSLSPRELAVLLLACSVDWRLGGGKPLGLGLCRPVRVVARDEHGMTVAEMVRPGSEPGVLPKHLGALVEDLQPRVHNWHAAQQPVAYLRYPRAVSSNRHRIQRGGHVWFQRHAGAKQGANDEVEGLAVLWIDDALRTTAGGVDHLSAQTLPAFDHASPQTDVLYGYDLYAGEDADWIREGLRPRRNFHLKLEPFDPAKHATGDERSSGFHGQNRERRQDERDRSRRDA